MIVKKLFILINLIIFAGLWLVACTYNLADPMSSGAALAETETSTPVVSSTVTSTTISDMPAEAIPATSPTTIFVIVMENTNWSEIKGSDEAPYLNNVLLPIAAHAEEYYNAPGVHPSEPNYLWLEAGTDFGIANDANPDANHQSSSMHLVTLLDQKGISWKSYQEDISGTDCPLTATGLYAPKHNPMVYFDDVTDTNNPKSPVCIAHVRPLSEMRRDLQNNTVAQYNFIVPNLCNDMHGNVRCLLSNRIQNGDDWLANNIPPILNSPTYTNGGVLFITWDEARGGSDGPIGLLVLSPKAKGGGYSNTIHYTHSSLLRTIQELFGVTPLLGDAAQATNLSDLFATFP
ncbi:MAG: phosphoesterase [Anaerolineaceae bacterium]|nr:phosphoesterase [Anaerolineaceae bacterium]MCB9102260.1 phosphoesterase [Anaerolineales bacterium]